MSYAFQVVVDCREPHVLADWWADALCWAVEPQDEQFIRRMISEGFATEADTTTHGGRLVWKDAAAISHPDGLGAAPRVLFQRVPEPKTVKNRMHLDVTGDQAELLSLGATLVRARDEDIEWDILADPEGNEFCVFAPSSP